MSMAARKVQPQPQQQKQQANVIPINATMPRLPKRLQALMQGSEKVSPGQLRDSMLALSASLGTGTFALLQNEIRRCGKGWGWSNHCMICGEPPPDWMHDGHKRRRWQSSEHLKHALKGETRADFEIHYGDVGPKR